MTFYLGHLSDGWSARLEEATVTMRLPNPDQELFRLIERVAKMVRQILGNAPKMRPADGD